MTFLSVEWIAWMWATTAVYWIMPKPWRLPFLAALTLSFLLLYNPVSAFILSASTALVFLVTRQERASGLQVGLAIAALVVVLFSYKIGQRIDGSALIDTVLIPLGLSYYTFRCVHVLIERLKSHIPPLQAPELIGYLFFLPTIWIGPIHRIDDYRRDLARQRFDTRLISEGAERILYGYAKVAVLSNFLTEGVFGDWILTLPDQEAPGVIYLTIVKDGLNLYFQFSGFSDIAIGFARLLGFRVMENFNWPYFQSNISAFWRSWYISLSQFCSLYINNVVLSLTRSPTLGALATMTVIGLWHEVSLRFLLWGAYHALGLTVWRKFSPVGARIDAATPQALHGLSRFIKILMTVHFVWFGWVILLSDNPAVALDTFGKLLFFWL
jgi:alginate O-acetyltransferase complex protein AlgI